MPWAGLLGAMLVLAMLRLDASVLWPPIFLLIGDASYSLYLLHPYVLVTFDRFVHPFGPNILGVVVSIVAICASVAIAIMGYRAVERPSNRYLRRVMG